MLRINLLPKKKKTDPIQILGWSVAFIFTLEMMSATVFAADITSPHISNAEGVYSIHGARAMTPGEMAVGAETNMFEGEFDKQTFKLQRTDLSFGLGLTSSLEFLTNVSLYQQDLDQALESDLFPTNDKNEQTAGFTGLLKWTLVDTGTFALAVAPFAEAGVGSTGESSLAQSSEAKGGWMSLMTLGEKGLVTGDLNFGYRYRNSESFANYLLRNELFYGAGVTGYFAREFGIFAAARGRSLKASDESKQQVGLDRTYENLNSLELSGGVKYAGESLILSVYAAQRQEDDAFGAAKQSIGAKVAYKFGGSKRKYRGKTFLSEDDKADNSEAIADVESAIKKEKSKKKKTDENILEEPKGKSEPVYDYFADFEKARNDFEDVKTDSDVISDELKKKAQDPAYKGVSEQEKRDAELRKIKEAEAAKKKYEEEQRKLVEKNRRENASRLLQEEEKKHQEIMDDLKEDIDALPQFDPIESDWDESGEPMESELF